MSHLLAGIPSTRHDEARDAIFRYLALVKRIHDRIATDTERQKALAALTQEESSGTFDGGRPPISSNLNSSA